MDSRNQLRTYYQVFVKWPLARKVKIFFLALGISITGTYFLGSENFDLSMYYMLFILLFAILLWVTEAIPPFAVGLLVIGLEVALLGSPKINPDPQDVMKYVDTWSSPVIWLLLGGFFMAEALKKTGLDKEIFKGTVRLFGTRPSSVLLGLMITTALLSMIMSNTATTAMMIAAITPFVQKNGGEMPVSKALLLGIPAAAAIGGMGTIIGSPPNAIAAGVLNKNGIEVNFLDWVTYGFPIAITLIFIFWLILRWKFNTKSGPNVELDLSEEGTNFTAWQTKLVIITLALTLTLWLTTPFHGIHVSAIAAIPIIILTINGIIKAHDVRALPWDTLMLVAGGLSLGVGISETGLAEYYINKMQTGTIPLIAFLFVFGFLTMAMSNIMSNTATTTILLPVTIVLLPLDLHITAVVVGLCASTALFLPVSTPPNAIAFSSGYLRQSDFRLGGMTMGLLGPAIIILWSILIL